MSKIIPLTAKEEKFIPQQRYALRIAEQHASKNRFVWLITTLIVASILCATMYIGGLALAGGSLLGLSLGYAFCSLFGLHEYTPDYYLGGQFPRENFLKEYGKLRRKVNRGQILLPYEHHRYNTLRHTASKCPLTRYECEQENLI